MGIMEEGLVKLVETEIDKKYKIEESESVYLDISVILEKLFERNEIRVLDEIEDKNIRYNIKKGVYASRLILVVLDVLDKSNLNDLEKEILRRIGEYKNGKVLVDDEVEKDALESAWKIAEKVVILKDIFGDDWTLEFISLIYGEDEYEGDVSSSDEGMYL